jgi:hypothetical protein
LTVLELNTDQTGAADKDRGHFFYNDPLTPFFIIEVYYSIAESQVKALVLVHAIS